MKHILFITLLLSAIHLPLTGQPEFKVVSSQDRLTSASEHISGHFDQIAVYTKGLVCSSCGIGLRVHLKKVGEIDRGQFNKGIKLDASNQLIIIAFKEGTQPNPEAVHKAIDDAGYEAAHYYQWNGESVSVHSFGKVE